MSVNFVIETFNYQLEMGVSGELFEIPIPVLDASANAEYYVSVSSMRNAFYFQTDSRDVNDLSGNDIKYYVNWPNNVVLNPCHAYVSFNAIASTDATGPIPSNRQLVKHDFIRHIAKDLFGTHLAVDLFSNEQALKDDLASKGHFEAWASILTDISDVSISNTNLSGPDASGEYYTTNELNTKGNLCRELLGQLITNAPFRLYDLSGIALNDNLALEKFSIPFQHGDSISFKLTLSAAPNQHLIIGKETAVPDRTYRIILNVVDTVNDDNTTYAVGTNVLVYDCIADPSLNNSRVKKSSGYEEVTSPEVSTTSTTSVSNFSLNGATMFVPNTTTQSTVTLTQSSTPPPESTYLSIPSVLTYIKLEPAGAIFSTHVSFEISVDPGTLLSLYFKSGSDLEPVVIPEENTSANDVYYTYVSATGIVTLYTKHFSEVFVTEPLSENIGGTQALDPNIKLSYITGYTHELTSATTIGARKTIVNKNPLDIITGFGISNTLPSSQGKIEFYNNEFYVTGAYIKDGVTIGGGGIVRWNGSAWVLFAELNGECRGMVSDNSGNLYIGGNFTTVNGTSCTRVAKWNGTTWSALGSGLNNMCQGLTYDNVNKVLYAGGDFTTAGGVTVNYIARWNGSAWSALSSGTSQTVMAVKYHNGFVYAGGYFGSASGLTVNRIARWNISTATWSAFSTGINAECRALDIDSKGNLYIVGQFTRAGPDSSITRIAKWDGTTWTGLSTGLNALAFSVAFDNNDNVYVGGAFTTAGGVTVNGFAIWNVYTSTWSTIGDGLLGGASPPIARSLLWKDGIMYVSGIFTNTDSDHIIKFNTPNTITGTFKKNNIVSTYLELKDLDDSVTLTWQGTYWNVESETINGTQSLDQNIPISYIKGYSHSLSSAVTLGTTKTIINKNPLDLITGFGSSNSLPQSQGELAFYNNELYVAGSYIKDGVSINGIVRWNGSAWVLFAELNGGCSCMISDNFGNLYIGGQFTTVNGSSFTRVAKWNGTSWSALGSGFNNTCQALTYDDANNIIYACGDFTTAGGVSVNYIAKWNGTTWSALSSGTNGTVMFIRYNNGYIYAGGYFTTASGLSANRIARWNISTSAWSAFGTGLNADCRGLDIDSKGNLYVGGNFTTAGGISAIRVARWNGTSWSSLSTGLNAYCFTLALDHNDNVYVGGVFTTSGGVSTNGLGIWNVSTSTWSTIGLGLSPNECKFLLRKDGVMYVAGNFTNTDSHHITKFNTPNTIRGTFKKNNVDLTYLELKNLNESVTLTWQGTYWSVP